MGRLSFGMRREPRPPKCVVCKTVLDNDERAEGSGRLCYSCLNAAEDDEVMQLVAKGLCHCDLCNEVVDIKTLTRHRKTKKCKYRAAKYQAKRKGYTSRVATYNTSVLRALGVPMMKIPKDPHGGARARESLRAPWWVEIILEANFDKWQSAEHVKDMAMRHAIAEPSFQKALQAAHRLGGSEAVSALLLERFHQQPAGEEMCSGEPAVRVKNPGSYREKRKESRWCQIMGDGCQLEKLKVLL